METTARSFKILRFAISALVTLAAFGARAQTATLSELALFHRCYTQLTSLRAKATDPLTVSVATGKLKAVDACMQVFATAQLSSNNPMVVSNTMDARATSVLTTFQRLHASWFYSKDFPVISWPGHAGDMRDLYDSTSPALYYTRALFGSGIAASDPLTTHDFLRAVRSNGSPSVGPESGHPLADFIYTTGFVFANTGVLQGIESAGSSTVSYPSSPGNQQGAGQIDLYKNFGGGFLGTQPYLVMNTSPLSSYSVYRTDGAVNMHRHYGKAVYRDALCRDLPVVRESDAIPFVDASSPTAFRTSTSCTKCHVSHDRISSVVRGMFVQYVGAGDPSSLGQKMRGGVFANFHPVTKGGEASWPSKPDSDYFQRPQNGEIYYRDYNGALVDESVSGLDDLGKKLVATDDYYICLAKRYYQYFTGIEVNTGDLSDPARKVTLNTVDSTHRNNVIALGKALKTSQSMSQMIKTILSLDSYKKVDFGVKGSGNGQ